MKRKAIVLLSSVLAGVLVVGGAFATYAVTDGANPFGINVSTGSVDEDDKDYVTLEWGSSTSLKAVGNLAVGENRRVGTVSLVAKGANYQGKFSLKLEDRTTAEKEASAADLFNYLNVYVFEGAVDLKEDGSLPEGEPHTILKAQEAQDGIKKLEFNALGTAAGKEFSIFVNLDNSAATVYTDMAEDKVYIEVDWNPQQGDEETGRIIYTYKPEGWAKLYAFTWKGNAVNAEFPGIEMVNVYDNVYRLSVPSEHQNVIFAAAKEGPQTDDLTFEGYTGTNAYWNGTAWTAVPEKTVIAVAAKVNGEAATLEDISSTSPNDKGVYSIELEENDVLTMKDGSADLHFYHFDTEEHDDGTEYTAPRDGEYVIYYNQEGHLYVSAPTVVEKAQMIVAPAGSWDNAVAHDLTLNQDDDNEYQLLNVELEEGDLIYFNLTNNVYKHYSDLKTGGASEDFANASDNLQVKEGKGGAYDIYVKIVADENGSIWVAHHA